MLFVIGSLFILTYCSEICQATSYQEVVGAFCGYKTQYLCVFFIIAYSYGACITFIIIIGDQFDRSKIIICGQENYLLYFVAYFFQSF